MDCSWKKNWEDTKKHFISWWNHEGFLLGRWTGVCSEGIRHECLDEPKRADSPLQHYTNILQRVECNHYDLSLQDFIFDILPLADMNMGPGSLASFLGAEPKFSPQTVWFEPCWSNIDEPESLPPICFDPQNRWWRMTEDFFRLTLERGKGKYLAGCPDLVENIDILALLRGTEQVMMDMVIRPQWIKQKLIEINDVWFKAYDRLYNIAKLEDGSWVFTAYGLWAPGKTAKVQCDASAMFSPSMFEEFVLPALSKQCEWLDYSLYHLDGRQCIQHLDLILSIEALDAIEWTPDPSSAPTWDPQWFSMYRKILDHGKSIQLLDVDANHAQQLFDAIGVKGVYLFGGFSTAGEAEKIMSVAQKFGA